MIAMIEGCDEDESPCPPPVLFVRMARSLVDLLEAHLRHEVLARNVQERVAHPLVLEQTPFLELADEPAAEGRRARHRDERTGSALTIPTPCSRLVPSIASAIARSPARPPTPARPRRAARRRRRTRAAAVERHASRAAARRARRRARSPPPEPKTSEVMFSTTPIRRMFVFCAISAGARPRPPAPSGCGVVTTTASARGRSWPSEIADVAGAGRHVHEQRVELAPVDVREELLERAVQHRPAPHDGRVVVEEEADRHQLQVPARRAGRSSCRRRRAAGVTPSMCGIEWP